MTKSEMESLLQEEVKGLTNYLTSPDFSNACDDASRETGFTFALSTDFQIQWVKERAKRHLFFYLLTESAHKFKYEQINLQHRFEHYRKLVEDMDKRYESALEDYYLEFSGASSVNVFGTKIDAGFQYDALTGRETTYDDANVTILTPTEND
jgi:hypothetical protein